MADFEAMTLQVDPDFENKPTTGYQQQKTTEIMESSLFSGESNRKDLRAVHLASFPTNQ
jgi:hypothetical protein